MSAVSDRPDATSQGYPRVRIGSPRRRLLALARRWAETEPFVAPPRADWPVALRRARKIGFALLALQLVIFGWWSHVLVDHSALTHDYTAYEQAGWLIAHGDLNPYSTVFGQNFWNNDSEFIMLPLGLLMRIGPSLVTLPWLQDIALVASQAIAFAWICDLAARQVQRDGDKRTSVVLVALGLLLLVGDPWFIWAASYDVHMESFAMLFAVGAARDLHRGRRTAPVWAVLGAACGGVCATYIGATGLSAILSGRRRLRLGAVVTAVGFGAFALFEITGKANHDALKAYAAIVTGHVGVIPRGLSAGMILKAALHHPGRAGAAIWSNFSNLWSNVSSGGLLGVAWLPVSLPILLTTAEAAFAQGGMEFSQPGFQNVLIPCLTAVGTIAACIAVHRWSRRHGRRGRRIFTAVVAALALNSVAWSVIWFPQVSGNWLHVSKGAAAVVSKLQKKIGPNDQVFVSQGVAGAFADRRWIYQIAGPKIKAPRRTRRIWFVLAPVQGIELESAYDTYANIADLESHKNVRLVAASDGVWAFEWVPGPGTRTVRLNASSEDVAPGWLLGGASGEAVRQGHLGAWHTTSTDKPGYIVDGTYLRARPGRFLADVRLTSSRPLYVEVWDSTRGILLQRLEVRPRPVLQTVRVTARLRYVVGQPTLHGWGIWSDHPFAPDEDDLEVRVWSPGGKGHTSVYSVAIKKLSAAG